MRIIKTLLNTKNDQRGASLAYTLVIITILMIIGSVLATFAIISLRLSVMQHASDKAFYLSDAAMEETLIQLESKVHEAEIFAVNRVNDHARYYEKEAKWQEFLSRLEFDTNNRLITKEESIAYLQRATSFEFQKQYYFYLFGQPTTGNWLKEDYKLLETNGTYAATNTIEYSESYFNNQKKESFNFLNDIELDPSVKVSYSNTPKPTMKATPSLTENAIKLTLVSSGEYNRYKKPITLNLSLTPPEYTQVVTANSSSVVEDNQILYYALAARGDILVSGTSNDIKGDVYTYGTFPEKGDYRISNQGGLMLGYRADADITTFPDPSIKSTSMSPNGNLNIKGNLYSRGAVRLYGNNSHLDVTGNIYANALQFDEKSSSGTLKIGSNAFIFEDVILDGENPSLTVGSPDKPLTGQLWGLMDASPTAENLTFKSTISSSIIVNTKSENPRITVNNVLMAGLVHFDVTRTDAGAIRNYQTGESFTTNNNFYFYKTPLAGFNSSLQSKFFTYKNGSVEHSLIEAVDTNGNIVKSPLFKDKYFYTSVVKNPGSVSTRDRRILTVNSLTPDSTNGFNGLNTNYSQGVLIANERVIDAYTTVGVSNQSNITSDYMTISDFTKAQYANIKEYDLQTSVMSVRDYKTHQNVNPYYSSTSTYDNRSNLEHFVDFSYGSVTNITNPNELIIINSEADKNIYLNIPEDAYNKLGDSEKDNGIFIRENNDRFRTINGMIITRGNIFVYNTGSSPFTYKGTMVSDKNICLLGTGKKEFTHDLKLLEMMIAQGDNIPAKKDLLKKMLYAAVGKKAVIRTYTTGNNTVETTSRVATLEIIITDNTTDNSDNLNSLPTGNGLVKSKTKQSFTINSWSMD